MNYDVVIIGAGPAGIFTALEMLRKGSQKKILIVEKGQSVRRRACPKSKTNRCVDCKPYCHITTGFSGAGAFSDGKLSLSCDVGGDLPERAVVRASARNAARHRFDKRKPEAFEKARKNVKSSIVPEFLHLLFRHEAGEPDQIRMAGSRRRGMDDTCILPVRSCDHERVRLGKLTAPPELTMGAATT